jgi:acyl-CoA synthetase (AMP-forming)/AMP-acid ligase II
VLTHRNLVFMSHCYYADIDALDERDTCLHAGPLSHGAGLYALPHLLRGGHQVVLPHFDVDAIIEALRRHSRVSLFAAPTMLTRLVHAPAVATADLANLRTIFYGGGPMYVADLERALGLFGPRLYQLYGQGESPMTITGLEQRMHAEATHPRWRERLGSCGVARTGVLVKVVDDDDRELPAGEVGEVVTKSDCVMEGYWGNPEATAEALRDGWLHTGDLGSFGEDGFLTLRPVEGHDHQRRQQHLPARDRGGLAAPSRPRRGLGRRAAAPRMGRGGRGLCRGAFGSRDRGRDSRPAVPRSYRPLQAAETLDRLCLDHIARFKRPRLYRFVDALPKNNYGKVLKTELRRQLAAEETPSA